MKKSIRDAITPNLEIIQDEAVTLYRLGEFMSEDQMLKRLQGVQSRIAEVIRTIRSNNEI